MSLFSSFSDWVLGGLRRSSGVQYTAPLTYSEEAASTVTFDSAMQLSAVWACTKLLSETVASLPLNVYKRTPTGRKEFDTHPLYVLFDGKVNKWQTKIEFFETVLLNLVISGNAYCQIERSGGRIVSLTPLMSSQVEPMMLNDGALIYNYITDDGIFALASENVWHLKLMGSGTVGMSPLAYQRNSLGIAQASESAVTKIYRNGAKPSGVITIDRVLTPAQRDQVRSSFSTLTVSTDDRLMVLEGGMKFDSISLSPQDIELLASRKFQISEICRWYGVPSVMVNDNNGTSVWGSGIEQVMQGFYKLTLRPLLEKIENSISVNLLTANERGRMEVEFEFDALLRSDAKSRFEAYRVGVNTGVMTPNEARQQENLPAMPGGDKLLVQGAMMPVDQIGMQPPAPEAPQPVADPQIDALMKSFAGVTGELQRLRDLTVAYKSRPEPVQQSSPSFNVNLDTSDLAKAAQSIERVAKKTLEQIREDVQNMPIVIPAPNVTVEAVMPEVKQVNPVVNVYNEVKPSDVTVVDNHPSRAIQTVERDANDEIVRTVTKFER
jgi:HK97 family phage portal protein